MHTDAINGDLVLEEDPMLWIRANQTRLPSVKSLKLDYYWHDGEHVIGDSIGDFTHLTRLSIFYANTIFYLPDTLPSLTNLQELNLECCENLKELPPNLGDLMNLTSLYVSYCPCIESLPESLTKLSKLTHLYIISCHNLKELPANFGELESLTQFKLEYCGSIKSLPNSLTKLSKLTGLDISYGHNLEELPANFGELESLTQFKLKSCSSIESLPNSLTKLSKLTGLDISYCDNLEELPTNFGELESLTQFTLHDCNSIKCLPNSVAKLSKLTTLNISRCRNLQDLPTNLGQLKSLRHLYIWDCESVKECPSDLNVVDLSLKGCCNIQSLPRGLSNLNRLSLPLCIDREEERLANLKYFVSLRYLHFTDCSLHKPQELPANLDKLPQLCVLDIQHTNIKCLPSTMLPQLRLLLLPEHFRLETLPYDLDESLIITVQHTHVRKTWKELKKEMEISSSTFTVDPPEYLQLTEDPRQWILDNYDSRSRVRILDLELYGTPVKDLMASISKLAELTHLYISDGTLSQLPLTFTRITHISLYRCRSECDMESFSYNLGKLSTLKSLHLLGCCGQDFSKHMTLPVSLTHLTLGSFYRHLPHGMAKLSNLKALHLSHVHSIDSFPENLNLEKLKLVNCDLPNIKPLPGGLRHMEILHTLCYEGCHYCNSLRICLNQLVAVETLSVTCHGISSFPSVAGLLTLQELQLKDCFSITELPANLEVIESIRTLNLSGTGIKSLPCSIWNLPNLQCLILPKWFLRKSVPLKFRNKGTFFDDTDDQYYKEMGYRDFDHETSIAVNDDTTNTIKGVKEVVSKESEQGILSQQQISPQQMLNQPHATLVVEDSRGSEGNYPVGQHSHHTICSYQNQETEFFPKNITLVSEAVDLDDYTFDGRDNTLINENSQHSIYHSRNQEETLLLGERSQHDLQTVQLPENTTWVNEDVSIEPEEVTNAEQQTSPSNFNSNGRNKLNGENSHHAVSHSQEMESLSPGACSEMIKELISNFQGSVSFGKNSNHAVQDGQMDIINSETEHEHISSSDKRDVSRSGNNLDALENNQIGKNSQTEGENRKRYIKRDITKKDIEELIKNKRMKLVDAAKELSVSRSTFKRKLKQYKIKWPKISNKRRNTELPSSSKISSEVNLVPVGNEYTIEGLDGGNQHILPNQESNQYNLSINTTAETVEVPMMETQLHTDDHERAQQFPNGANPSRLSTTIQESGSSCSFVVKATYKGDTVKFVSSSSTIVEIKDEVADNLELELGKFKIKYEDSDKELLLMTKNKHLEDARNLSYSSGSNFVRLFIIDL